MGTLTDDMTRLRDEATAMRNERQALLRELQRGTADLQTAVAGMTDGFRQAQRKMAEDTHAECATFLKGVEKAVTDLQKTVGGLRKEFAADVQGARRAWTGQGPSSRASTGRPSPSKGGTKAKSRKKKSG
ncbi:MAG: hypothetical protein R6X20_00780 [Phycisphaerae bacterium]